jgi:hypothetical protein
VSKVKDFLFTYRLRGFLQAILFAFHIIISQYHTVRKEMLDLINIIGIEITCSAEHFHRGGYPDGSLVNGIINTSVLTMPVHPTYQIAVYVFQGSFVR